MARRTLKQLQFDKKIYSIKGARNPYRRHGNDIYILCANGKEAIVDEIDFINKYLYKHLFYSCSSNPTCDYPTTKVLNPFGTDLGDFNTCKLHKLVLGELDGYVGDHINGDHYDCRRKNLRFCTIAQNNQNRHKMSAEECYWKNPDRHFPETKLF